MTVTSWEFTQVRLCMRFTPVLAVCQADLGEVKQTANRILGPLFPAEATQKKFAVVYEHRASAKLDRMAVVNAVAEDIPQVPTPLLTLHAPCLPSECLYVSTSTSPNCSREGERERGETLSQESKKV